MPKLVLPKWLAGQGGAHPITGQGTGPYAERVLGDLADLTQFGVRIERLPPGSRSSHRHWHETEDEFMRVLSGTLVLIEDVETVLHQGDMAAWAAGAPIAHCLENRGSEDAVILIIGFRAAAGRVHYPGATPSDELVLEHDQTGRRWWRADGSEFTP